MQPIRRFYTPEQEAAEWLMIRQTEALLNAVDAAWLRSDQLFWALTVTHGRHPLDTRLVADEAARFGVQPRWRTRRNGSQRPAIQARNGDPHGQRSGGATHEKRRHATPRP